MNGYRTLPRNARTCILVEPLWAFFGPMVSYYMPLYQRSLGLGEIQMGVVNSVNIAAGLLFYAFAAPITNRLGRRKTSMLFDFVAWSLTMALWAVSRSYAAFLVAAVTNAVVRVVYVSWNLLISEDATEEQRSTIFGYINIIGTFGGFTSLASGAIIAALGVVPAMRAIFWAGAATMTLMFVLRFVGTSETKTGKYLIEKTKGENFFRLAARQIPQAWHALKEPFFLRMTGIYFIGNAVLSIDFFRILYMKDVKGLSSFVVSAIPALSSVASIIVFFVILPRRKVRKNRALLADSFLACLVTQILFIFMPKSSWLAAVLVFPSLQTSYALFQTFRDTVFMNGTAAELKSERYSLVQALMMLFSIPVGWLAGLLYAIAPPLPFVLAGLLYAAGFLLARGLGNYEPAA